MKYRFGRPWVVSIPSIHTLLDTRTEGEYSRGHIEDFRFYDTVMNDRAQVEASLACGMDK